MNSAAEHTSIHRLPPAPPLLLGGFLLAVMSYRLQGLVPPERLVWSWLLLALGAAAMGGGALAWLRIDLLRAWGRPLTRLAGWFHLSEVQPFLLLLAFGFGGVARLAAGPGLQALDGQMAAAAWLLAAAAAVGGSWRLGQTGGSQPGPNWTRPEIWLVAALFGAALLLRLLFLDAFPSTLTGDEGSSGLEAARFLAGEVDNVLTVGWFSFPSLYFWVQSLGLRLLGQTTEGLRLLSAVAGALTVPAVYWLVRQIYGRATGGAAAALLAAAHYHIHFSRIGLNNIWDGLFAVLVLGLIWRGWRSGGRVWFILGGLLLGLSQYFYASMRIFPLLILLWAGLALFLERETLRRRLPDLVVMAAVSLVVFLPLALYYVNYPDQFSAPLQRVSIFNGWLAEMMAREQQGAFLVWLGQLQKAAFGITHVPLRHWYVPGTALLLPVTVALFVVGLALMLRRPGLGELLLLLPLAGVVLMSTFSQDLPSAQRYIIASPLALIVAARPLGLLHAALRRGRLLGPAGRGALLGGLLLGLAGWDAIFYFRDVSANFVLGGINTEVATAAAYYLEPYDDPATRVYFAGFPRMGYRSHASLPYLVPAIEGHDILEPLAAPPEVELGRPTFFIFLPERFDELDYVKQSHPNGTLQAVNNDRGELLFISYRVEE